MRLLLEHRRSHGCFVVTPAVLRGVLLRAGNDLACPRVDAGRSDRVKPRSGVADAIPSTCRQQSVIDRKTTIHPLVKLEHSQRR